VGVTSRRPFIRIGIRGHRRAARHHDYDSARAIWTGCIDARPALIARCRTTEDIAAAVTLTREVAVPLAVRAGGHSVAGLSTCDGGVVIDLSPMRGVSVDVDRRTATVQPGATWADLDAATATAGLATTGGLISTTGVAGLALGVASAGCSASTGCRATT
jgi:FAD/FMN-containing dehydrogenase